MAVSVQGLDSKVPEECESLHIGCSVDIFARVSALSRFLFPTNSCTSFRISTWFAVGLGMSFKCPGSNDVRENFCCDRWSN